MAFTEKHIGLRRLLAKQTNEQSKAAADGSASLGAPGDIEGLGKPTIKFEFESNDELKDFLKENKETLIDSYVDAEIIDNDKALTGYGDKYEVLDLRKRSKKEPGEVKALSTKNIKIQLKEKAPRNYDPDKTGDTKGYSLHYFTYKDDNSPISLDLTYKGKSGNYGSYKAIVNVDFARLYNWKKHPFNVLNYEAVFENDYYFYLTDKWCLEYGQKVLDDNTYDKYYDEDRKKEIAKAFILDSGMLDDYATPETKAKLLDLYKKRFYKRYKGMSGSLDGSRNPDKYNYKLSDLKCGGLKPTYQKLSDYSRLINEKAVNKNYYLGDGFDVTEKLLLSTVMECYKSVKPLADHLKGDSKTQSAFNVWYWLHENIRYNYDAEGLEEIRSPARSWKDRKKGVDCDCLAVFTYCLLLNMGYAPKFEIVAFLGGKSWAHIFVNLDGLAVDRVLNKFGSRPALISKTKMLEVPVYSLRGVPDNIMEGLAGLEAKCLAKMKNGIATELDCCNYRKANAFRRMSGDPLEQRVMQMFMPYVYDVDLTDGSLYFLNPKVAAVASWADSKLMQLANKYGHSGLNGSPEYEAELMGIFKKIGNAVKKAVTAPVKAVVNTTKAAVKATTNVVKATVNTVKAGVQAATGNKEGAKESINKAGSQIKSAVVDPVKTEVNNVKTVVKDTIVQPTVTAVKVTTELVKVLLVKINPVTVIMRNAFRALVAINFLGLASRLGVGSMVKEEAAAYSITEADWTLAQKAYNRVIKFYTKMGGDKTKMENTIRKNMFKKALFKGDYKLTQTITDSDELKGLGELGEPVTVGSCLAAVGAFFAKIWNWIKNIVPKIAEWYNNNKETIKTVASTAASLMNKNGSESQAPENTTEQEEPANNDEEQKNKNVKTALIIAGVALAGYVLFKGKGKGKGKGKKSRR